MDNIVDNKYILQQKIGQGSFGQIYIAIDKDTGERYAVKVEDNNVSVPQLLFEARIYQIMAGSTNVPRLFYQAEDFDRNVIVIELLGNSLEGLLTKCDRHMSVKTVCMLAEQMITSVQFFHSKNYIHRDLKPDNFVMGKGNCANKLYIIDYGLAKRYRDQNTHQHIKFSSGKSLTGTARYASINALAGYEQSRRDDIEGLAYVLIYLCKGSLPWMGIDAKDRKEKYAKICESKRKTSPEVLCQGLPSVFAQFLVMARGLSFEQEPDYVTYRSLFRNYFISQNWVYDYQYDWSEVPYSTMDGAVPRRTVHKRRQNYAVNATFSSDQKYFSVDAVKSGEFATVGSQEKMIKPQVTLPDVGAPINTIDMVVADDKKVTIQDNEPKKASRSKKRVVKKGTKKVVKKKMKKSQASRKPLPHQPTAGIIQIDLNKSKEERKPSVDVKQQQQKVEEEQRRKAMEEEMKRRAAEEEQRKRRLEEEQRKKQQQMINQSEERKKSNAAAVRRSSSVERKHHHHHHHRHQERNKSVEQQPQQIEKQKETSTDRYKSSQPSPRIKKRKVALPEDMTSLNTVDQFLIRRGAMTPQNLSPAKVSKRK